MAYTRSDLITEIRDNLYETNADLWTDAQLVKHLRAEVRSLPKKNIYLEEIHTTTTVQDQIDYVLPTSTNKVEMVETDLGSGNLTDWQELKGWDNYGGAIYLPYRPSAGWTLRLHIKKGFTDLTTDGTTTDVPDDKVEVVVWGTCCRAYRQLMGYFVDARNWDSVGKPDGISMNQVRQWYDDARREYKDLIQIYRSVPRNRDINLVG